MSTHKELAGRLRERAEYHKRVAEHDPTFTESERFTEALLCEAADALDTLAGALEDLVSWFPDNPAPPEWRLPAGQYGADDAIEAAHAALATIPAKPDTETNP